MSFPSSSSLRSDVPAPMTLLPWSESEDATTIDDQGRRLELEAWSSKSRVLTHGNKDSREIIWFLISYRFVIVLWVPHAINCYKDYLHHGKRYSRDLKTLLISTLLVP